MVSAGCREPRDSLKYDSRNLDACSRTQRFAFSLLSAIAAGLEADFCSKAAAAAVEVRPPPPPVAPFPSFRPSTAAAPLFPPDEDFTHLAGCNCDRIDDVLREER